MTQNGATTTEGAVPTVNILLVDDRRENLLALQGILAGPGYELMTAQSGAAALEAVLAHDFAVILLDVSMPGMDGFECASLIKQRPRCCGTPIIFITASIYDLDHIYRGYSVGAVDYLQKPVSPAIVRAKVAVFVALFKQREQIKVQGEMLAKVAQRERDLVVVRAEAALSASEAQYEATTRGVGFGATLLEANGAWVRVNRSMGEMLGYTLCPLPALDGLYHPESSPEGQRVVNSVLTGTLQSATLELQLAHRTGHPVWVQATLSRLSDAAASRSALVCEDINERKWAELRQRFLNQASAGLLSALDYQTTIPEAIALAVPQLADWCAVDVVQPDGHHVRELVLIHRHQHLLPEVRAFRQRAWWDAKSSEPRTPWAPAYFCAEVAEEQLRAIGMVPGKSRLVPHSVILVPITAQGEVLGAVTFATDTPGRTLSEADRLTVEDFAHRCAFAIENTRLYEQAQQAVRARDEFLSVASHELRTPLTPLRLQLQRLTGTPHRPPANLPMERVREILQRSHRHVERLGALVENLLDVSRIASGRMKLEREPTDLGAMVSDVVGRFSEEIGNSGSDIQLELDDGVLGDWDRSCIEQVVTNLISNAVKYGCGKSVQIGVHQDIDGGAHLAVRDYGIGICTEKLQLIFERFERAASARAYGGLGLGLFIARQIVNAHGGTIRVESTLGEGSTFYVELPMHPASHQFAGTSLLREVTN